MEKKLVVAALGHYALGKTFPEQKRAVKEAAKAIADLVENGANVVITHSNAPQVGMIHTALNEYCKENPEYTAAPMSVCSAMSQGYIGYDLQNAIRAELMIRGIYKPVTTLITQVLVDPYDPAFYKPSKVIGRILNDEEAKAEEEKGNFVVKEGNGFRKAVAAPHPKKIIELDSIKTLAEAGHIVIACGGGGIPVLEQGVDLRGASAVIEKDLIGGKLAVDLDADVLMILTSVDQVSLHYKSEQEKMLGTITAAQAKQYMEENHFEAGSMLPKFEAAIDFVESGEGKEAIITSIARARAAFNKKAGTIITE
ncbi:MAG: carbamate kinase [Lachnospiraceae bacterium]|nr:carbamate kinase [Lachnospiraceae bacterium]